MPKELLFWYILLKYIIGMFCLSRMDLEELLDDVDDIISVDMSA